RRLGLLLLAVAACALLYVFHQLGKASAALEEGRQALRRGRHAEARGTFRHGLALAEDLPFGGDLVQHLRAGLRQAEHAELAVQLHATADRLRGLFGAEEMPRADAQAFERLCREFWRKRYRIRMRLGPDLPAEAERQIRADLLDLALLWSDLLGRVAALRARPLRLPPGPPRGGAGQLHGLRGAGAGERGLLVQPRAGARGAGPARARPARLRARPATRP